MGYVVIGLGFGVLMLSAALAAGWGLGMAALVGWLSASLGVMGGVAMAAARMTDPIPIEVDVEIEAV